jgi:hypothetical protein
MSFEIKATPSALTEVGEVCSSPWGIFAGCPRCATALGSGHARFRCLACGWRDSSVD